VARLRQEIERCVAAALAEDQAVSDATTRLLVPGVLEGRASVISRGDGVISGQDCPAEVFRQLGGEVDYEPVLPDGARAVEGQEVAVLRGPLGTILSGERTALNFLCRLSGISTLTAAFVEKVAGSGARILDTRKTTPGMRALEKKAVADGGGFNHRQDLASYILVKENHIAAAGGLEATVERLGEFLGGCEIEVRDLGELRLLQHSPPGRIMLDNFKPGIIVEALEIIRSWKRIPEIEVSGGITLENVAEYAVDGVDFLSVGALTMSATSFDMTLLVE
jgi:nicotinate-nucleotide pyrophosphorylase (carboxylating)